MRSSTRENLFVFFHPEAGVFSRTFKLPPAIPPAVKCSMCESSLRSDTCLRCRRSLGGRFTKPKEQKMSKKSSSKPVSPPKANKELEQIKRESPVPGNGGKKKV